MHGWYRRSRRRELPSASAAHGCTNPAWSGSEPPPPELGEPQILLTARCVGPQHCCSHRLLRITWPPRRSSPQALSTWNDALVFALNLAGQGLSAPPSATRSSLRWLDLAELGALPVTLVRSSSTADGPKLHMQARSRTLRMSFHLSDSSQHLPTRCNKCGPGRGPGQ